MSAFKSSSSREGGPAFFLRDRLARLRRALLAKAMRSVLPQLNRALPFTFSGDRAFNYVEFLFKQSRFPRKRMLFNDYLFRMQMSGELLSLPRQIVSDKEFCKVYVDHKIGAGRTIPTIAVLRSKDDVSSYAFPDRCVIKATHSSGLTVIRGDGESLDFEQIRSWFDKSLYSSSREQNYKYLESKVIIEPIVFDGVMFEIKIHCYRGEARVFSVQPVEAGTLERFDRYWNRMPLRQNKPLPSVSTPRPDCLDEIIAAADKLSSDFEYIRVDFYVCNKAWLVGELTNCHTNINSRFPDLKQEQVFSRTLFGDEVE